MMRNHGLINRDKSLIWGTNSRLDNLQAGFGNIMLKKISSWNKKQLNIAKTYTKHLSKILKTPKFNLKISNPTFHQYIIRTKYRNKLKNYLKRITSKQLFTIQFQYTDKHLIKRNLVKFRYLKQNTLVKKF